ncbi:MAG: helix-turn-helix domain-containing protein [Streptosporangiales bacterium]|nr:helix-turn-helix domain-containing protein [Streptosporangiales bacterium]
MSSPSSSAQATLRGLGGQLRELRQEAGLTAIALAVEAGWDRTKVSQIEHARRPPSVTDVRTWCSICGAEDQADDLVTTLRRVEDAYVQWKRLQRTGLRHLQGTSVPLYEQTRLMRVYSASVVPGLLQTPEYARALMSEITEHARIPNDVDDAVEARMARRRVLREGDHRFAFVLEEAVLTYGLGGRDVMAEQLEHLLTDMALPSVSLGVIPVSPDRRRWPLETFQLFDTVQARVELLAAQVTVTAPTEVAQYVDAFEQLASMAVYGRAARELIQRATETVT